MRDVTASGARLTTALAAGMAGMAIGCAGPSAWPEPGPPATTSPSPSEAPHAPIRRVLPDVRIVTGEPPRPASSGTRAPATPNARSDAPQTADAVIRSKLQPAVRDCYRAALRTDARLAGAFVLTLDVMGDGHVANAFVSMYVGKIDGVAACVAMAAPAILFPAAADGGPTRLRAPLLLVPRPDERLRSDFDAALVVARRVSSCIFPRPADAVGEVVDLRLTLQLRAPDEGPRVAVSVDGADRLPASFKSCVSDAGTRPDWPPLRADELTSRVQYFPAAR